MTALRRCAWPGVALPDGKTQSTPQDKGVSSAEHGVAYDPRRSLHPADPPPVCGPPDMSAVFTNAVSGLGREGQAKRPVNVVSGLPHRRRQLLPGSQDHRKREAWTSF
jgi:hypothetical protein